MKFCPLCEAVMQKNTTAAGAIVYQCKCQTTIAGGPDDTLMAEGYLETDDSNLKHAVFIENSPFDPAANVILKDCPSCKLNFLVMVRIGPNEVTMYSCECGYRATHDEYMKTYGNVIVSDDITTSVKK
jgi:DNA-directed RNA polymerase subunit M/transcription elongation factor TFIIS